MDGNMLARQGPRLILGVAAILLGLLLGLDNLGLVDASRATPYWPVLLIGLGLLRIVFPATGAGIGSGVGWILAGGALLLSSLGHVSLWQLWPFALVLIGGRIVFCALLRERSGPVGPADPSSHLGIFAFLGGVERTVRTMDFRGGWLTAFMGGCEIDLRGASIEGGSATIDAIAIWGGIELKVPEDWRIENRGLALLGGFGDKTRGPSDSPKVLIVTGFALMGGVDIKN
jgi:hypothetical protein